MKSQDMSLKKNSPIKKFSQINQLIRSFIVRLKEFKNLNRN